MQSSKIKINNFSKTSLFTIYLLLSLINLVVLWGQNPIYSFIAGQLIIALIVIDFIRSPYHFHIYQIINFYFYYSLVISHSFNTFALNQENYEIAYLINFIHFVFFTLGYLLLRYEDCPVRIIPRQNYIYLIYHHQSLETTSYKDSKMEYMLITLWLIILYHIMIYGR